MLLPLLLLLLQHEYKYGRTAGEVYHAYQVKLEAVKKKMSGAKRSWLQRHVS
jgi:hypothetical protein